MVIRQPSGFLKKNLYRGVNAFQHTELVLWLSRGREVGDWVCWNKDQAGEKVRVTGIEETCIFSEYAFL